MDRLQAQGDAAPFDAIAARYDETFTTSKIGYAQRASVWKELEKAFRPGDSVLEIGCGTGIDACFLAERGVTVVACDSSPQMLSLAIRRIQENGRDRSVHPHLLAAEDIARLRNRPFDGAFSNFGALNCVGDLHQFARDLALLLKPGATALLCWMRVGSRLVSRSGKSRQSVPPLSSRRGNRSPVRNRNRAGSLSLDPSIATHILARISSPIFQGDRCFGSADLCRVLGEPVSPLFRFEHAGRFISEALSWHPRVCRSHPGGISARKSATLSVHDEPGIHFDPLRISRRERRRAPDPHDAGRGHFPAQSMQLPLRDVRHLADSRS